MPFYDLPSQNSPKVKSDWVLTATLSRLEEQECVTRASVTGDINAVFLIQKNQ